MLGRLDDLDQVLAAKRIDQIYIALPVSAHKKTLRILQRVGTECVDVKLVPDILQYATLRASIEDLDGTPVINLSQVPLKGWSSLVKRGMDLLISSAALLVLLPFFPLVALAIWLEDRGPILYRQERAGQNGRRFTILKFRSMRVDAERDGQPVWAAPNDPRVTRVGRWLRRTSLDEYDELLLNERPVGSFSRQLFLGEQLDQREHDPGRGLDDHGRHDELHIRRRNDGLGHRRLSRRRSRWPTSNSWRVERSSSPLHTSCTG